MEDWQHGGFGLYIHWPFCESKCPYCDFNSHVATHIDQNRWNRAYLTEIDRLGLETRGRRLDSVFFGGGTPSLMSPDIVAAILERVRATWPMRNDPEITLEANPGSIEAGRFRGYRDGGVTRVSMGMQAMNDVDLRRLGRRHTAAEARKAFEIARDCFDRVSFDLIYARQDQSANEWSVELSKALDLAIDHLSLYQLTIEDGTAFGDRLAKGGLKGLPSDDLSAELYEITQDLANKRNMPAYEVSNHARAGSESAHNLIYWRGGDYIGIGPGAHGRITAHGIRQATVAPKAPGKWLELVEASRPGEFARDALSPKDHALEYLMMSIRLTEGLDLQRYGNIAGKPLKAESIEALVDLGMVVTGSNRLKSTVQGRMVLNAVIRELAED